MGRRLGKCKILRVTVMIQKNILLCIILILCYSCESKGKDYVEKQNCHTGRQSGDNASLPIVTKKDILSNTSKEKIDALMQSAMQRKTFPGGVLLVAHNDNVIFREAYGYSSTIPKKEKMTCETLFDVASMTKCVVTATVIMKLIENGSIKLNDPVKKYIKDFKPWNNGNETVDITIQQLLTHSSGLDAGLSMRTVNKLRSEWGTYDTKKLCPT